MRSLFRSKFKITQKFGRNNAYYKKFGLRGHEGLDIIPTGKSWDVLCLEDGIVVKDEDNPRSGAYGVYCTVWHSSIKKATQYAHLKENFVKVGDRVKKGQRIGIMGGTGNVTGKHLHLNLFEVDENGYRLNRNNGYLGGIDPLPFLEQENGVEDLQIIINKLREERDKNWNTAMEYKSQLEGCQANKNSLEEFRKQLAEKLSTEDQPNSILDEIVRLVSIEDRANELSKTIDEEKVKRELVEKDLEKLEEQLKEVKIASQTYEIASKTCGDELRGRVIRVKELKDEIKRLKKRRNLDKFTISELLLETLRRIFKYGKK